MAVDTRDKRFSMIGVALAFRLVLPNPDGANSQGDRQQTVYCYAGLEFAEPATLGAADARSTWTAQARRTQWTAPERRTTWTAKRRTQWTTD